MISDVLVCVFSFFEDLLSLNTVVIHLQNHPRSSVKLGNIGCTWLVFSLCNNELHWLDVSHLILDLGKMSYYGNSLFV